MPTVASNLKIKQGGGVPEVLLKERRDKEMGLGWRQGGASGHVGKSNVSGTIYKYSIVHVNK